LGTWFSAGGVGGVGWAAGGNPLRVPGAVALQISSGIKYFMARLAMSVE